MTSERIERFLDLKRFTKEQIEAEARQKREELRVEVERLKVLENLFNETVEKFYERQREGLLDTKEINMFHDYLAYMERRLKEQNEVVRKKREALTEKEKEVMKAHREKRIFEILRDSAVKEEIRESLVKEQKEMDLDFIMRRLRR